MSSILLKPIWVGYLAVNGLNQDWQNFRIFRMGVGFILLILSFWKFWVRLLEGEMDLIRPDFTRLSLAIVKCCGGFWFVLDFRIR